MKFYKVADLMRRYNLTTRQGITQFVRKNLKKINEDGEHARQVNGEWVFDEAALAVMDELRDTNHIYIIEEENEKLREQAAEIENLKRLLFEAQTRLIGKQEQLENTQQQLITIQQQLLETKQQLSESQIAYIEMGDKLSESKIVEKTQISRIAELENQLVQGLKAIETVEQLRKRNFLQRLFNV